MVESTTVHIPVRTGGIFYFSWHRHPQKAFTVSSERHWQGGVNGIAKVLKRSCSQWDSNPSRTVRPPVQANALTHSATAPPISRRVSVTRRRRFWDPRFVRLTLLVSGSQTPGLSHICVTFVSPTDCPAVALASVIYNFICSPSSSLFICFMKFIVAVQLVCSTSSCCNICMLPSQPILWVAGGISLIRRNIDPDSLLYCLIISVVCIAPN